jgi:hypothetical protein
MTPRLNIVEGQQQGRPTKRLVREGAIGGGVSRKHEGREIHQHTNIIGAEKAAAWLLEVGPKAIQRHRKARNMKSVPNKNPLAIEGNDSQTASKNRKVRVVPHSHLQVRGGLVGDKRQLVWEHVIGSTRAGNRETAT